ncbi:MAG: hypothetical protein LC667_19010, partial [Thioalkalivibrio sp.]|nr:hypothetical protein [Thioalkalivibrio sp.]
MKMGGRGLAFAAALALCGPVAGQEAVGPVPDSLDGAAYTSIEGRRATIYFVPGQVALAERMR